ncbi:uncharacterized protein LOC135833259 [Planococcus citri]|uniref:uncharacterized protein LOC135833259 n=1 Tax=Planococcus citri TaxID=170843 RepID=UPI0031FA1FBB
MHSVSVILISAYLVTLALVVPAEETDSQDVRYVEECNLEQNFSDFPYTLEMLNASIVPKSIAEACITDCYFFKRGQIVEKIHPTFVQYMFAPPPLEDSIYGPGFKNMTKGQAKAVNHCMKFVSDLTLEKCYLIYELRFCLYMELYY